MTRRGLSVVASASIAALAACAPAAYAVPRAHPAAAWRPVPSASIACHSAVLAKDPEAAVLDVAATGPADAWAVGICGADGGTHDFVGQTPTGFVEHWNGHRWSRVTVPASGEYDVVQAISPKNVWVAGVAGDPVPASQAGNPAAMPSGAHVIHWNGQKWTVAQQGIAKSASVYALAAAGGCVWMLAYDHGATTVLHWTGRGWRPVAAPAGFRFASTPQPPAADPVGGGFLAGSGSRLWIGGETGATKPVIARRTASGWATVPVPVTKAFGWIDAMTASGPDVWVRVDQSGNASDSPGQAILERFDGRRWTTVSATPLPPVNWTAAEVNVGLSAGGYLLCTFRVSAAQRAAFYGFGWTCPTSLAVTALAPVPGRHALWAAGAHNPGLSMRPAFALFS